MALFQLVLALLLVSAALTIVAEKLDAPYPSLLALAGAGLALACPGVYARLDPQLALVLFVAPTLLDAAYDASPRDLRAHWLPVCRLVLVAVVLTVGAVAVVARLIVPSMPWPVAFVLGAIVAPPDASAAAAIIRKLAIPHRLVVILEGESLLNDASALIIYRIAVASVGGTAFSFWPAMEDFILTTVGGAAFGFGCAWLYLRVISPRMEIAALVVTQFALAFGTWSFAERLGCSPVIATVALGLVLARASPLRLDAEYRRVSYGVWGVAVFVLNALAFVLIGLQLRNVINRVDGDAAATAAFAGAIFLTVVFVRILWVIGFTSYLRHTPRRFNTTRPPLKGSIVVAWCGMRGIVTLAAALALPDGSGGEPVFPFRDLLIAAAFAVVLGTLVLQGLTLAPLLRLLKLSDDGVVDLEVSVAREEAALQAIATLRRIGTPQAEALIKEYDGTEQIGDRRHLRVQILRAQRLRLISLRQSSIIGTVAFHKMEEELDWAEIDALRTVRQVRRLT